MSRKKDDLLKKLQSVAEHCFLEGLRSDVTPHVMGCLPDPVEAERRNCLRAGISEDMVNETVNMAWQRVIGL